MNAPAFATLPRDALDGALHGALPALHAVVDAARCPEAWNFVRRAGDAARCLFTGEAVATFADAAPYLVALDATRLDAWLAEAWGNAWGVLIHDAQPPAVLAEDLRRAFVARLPDGRRVLFRHYDPRVLRGFGAHASVEARWMFHRRIGRFVLESRAGEALVLDRPSPQCVDGQRLEALDAAMRTHRAFPIELEVAEAFRAEARRRFVERVLRVARGRHAACASASEASLEGCVEALLPVLHDEGVRSERAVAAVALHMLTDGTEAFWSAWPSVRARLRGALAGEVEAAACAFEASREEEMS